MRRLQLYRRVPFPPFEKLIDILYSVFLDSLPEHPYDIRIRGRDVPDTAAQGRWVEALELRHLASHPNKAVTHRELLQAVWGPDYGDEVDYLRVVMNQLRKKIEENPAKPIYLLTEPWVGYRFVPPPAGA